MRKTELDWFLEIQEKNRKIEQEIEQNKKFYAVLEYLGIELVKDELGDWRAIKKEDRRKNGNN